MDKETIYRKTSAGTEAIATRPAGLAPRQRSLLILVDGHRDAGELAKLAAPLGDPAELLQGLLALGYVEPLAAAAGSRAPSASVAPARDGLPLAQARTIAVRRLNEMLGPAATDLCLRLERSHTVQEFRVAVRSTETALRQVVGPQRAAQFVHEVENARAA